MHQQLERDRAKENEQEVSLPLNWPFGGLPRQALAADMAPPETIAALPETEAHKMK